VTAGLCLRLQGYWDWHITSLLQINTQQGSKLKTGKFKACNFDSSDFRLMRFDCACIKTIYSFNAYRFVLHTRLNIQSYFCPLSASAFCTVHRTNRDCTSIQH